MSGIPEIDPDELGASLAGERFCRIETVDETGSTNADLIERGRAGEDEGLVLVADMQREGHGRLGREWVSPIGANILCSVLARPALAPEKVPLLTVAAGLAGRGGIEKATGLVPELKWPNDLMVGGKKLGGILTESVSSGGAVEFAVIGAGINVNWSASDIPAEIKEIATSISEELGGRADRQAILHAYLVELDQAITLLERDEDALISRYREGCSTIGRDVSVRSDERLFEGEATGIDAHGRLLVETSEGETVAVDVGDVTEFRSGR